METKAVEAMEVVAENKDVIAKMISNGTSKEKILVIILSALGAGAAIFAVEMIAKVVKEKLSKDKKEESEIDIPDEQIKEMLKDIKVDAE